MLSATFSETFSGASSAFAAGFGLAGVGAFSEVLLSELADFAVTSDGDSAGAAGFGLADFLALPPAGGEEAYASFSRRTTGASTVEDAERTNSPIS
jgi:hypothetical protein